MPRVVWAELAVSAVWVVSAVSVVVAVSVVSVVSAELEELVVWAELAVSAAPAVFHTVSVSSPLRSSLLRLPSVS